MKVEPRTLKGFRDFLPVQARKRQFVLDTLKKVFESYGFEPLETPALEYEEILTGKYGEEGDKLMYRFTDNGGRKVAMRYDQTVPLSRVFAQYYQSELPIPFMRYQMQNVWRAENTQRGRFREFLQCDADIVGTSSSRADVQIIVVAISCLYKLGFKNFKVLINDRDLFNEAANLVRQKFPNILEKQLDIFFTITTAVDKLKKIDREGVIKELINKGFSEEEAKYCLEIVTKQKPTKRLQEIIDTLNFIKKDTIPEGITFEFSPTLARGLDYYTSTIFEIEIEGYDVGSIAGGGRYDNLIGMFTKYNEKIPAVGFAFGFDRLIDALDILKITPAAPPISEILVTVQVESQNKSLGIANALRNLNKRVELYLGDDGTSLEKQLKYADKKQIPFVVIVGEKLILKDMQNRTQEELTLEEIINKLK